MLLGFKRRFATAVERGEKRQTIRMERLGRGCPCTVDEILHLYVGLRRKGARKLGEGVCAEVFPIRIMLLWPRYIALGNPETVLSPEAATLFAKRDGFQSLDEFFEFFKTLVRKNRNIFRGWVIRWELKP